VLLEVLVVALDMEEVDKVEQEVLVLLDKETLEVITSHKTATVLLAVAVALEQWVLLLVHKLVALAVLVFNQAFLVCQHTILAVEVDGDKQLLEQEHFPQAAVLQQSVHRQEDLD
jgi:hypothetical protein